MTGGILPSGAVTSHLGGPQTACNQVAFLLSNASSTTGAEGSFCSGTFGTFLNTITFRRGHAVAKWLRHYATNWKVVSSIPDEVIFKLP
jgi:hypothetical protein